jgi:hypothetical protein
MRRYRRLIITAAVAAAVAVQTGTALAGNAWY